MTDQITSWQGVAQPQNNCATFDARLAKAEDTLTGMGMNVVAQQVRLSVYEKIFGKTLAIVFGTVLASMVAVAAWFVNGVLVTHNCLSPRPEISCASTRENNTTTPISAMAPVPVPPPPVVINLAPTPQAASDTVLTSVAPAAKSDSPQRADRIRMKKLALRRGDTLLDIAGGDRSFAEQIARCSGLANWEHLESGWILLIPPRTGPGFPSGECASERRRLPRWQRAR
jgi:hypothetical protein